MIARSLVLLFGALLIVACGSVRSAGEPAASMPKDVSEAGTDAPRSAVGEVDFGCDADADCAVKDVGNCCGYYPACVNRDSPTFPEQVKAQCARDGTMAVCGFPSISGCVCRDKRCEAVTGPNAEAEVR